MVEPPSLGSMEILIAFLFGYLAGLAVPTRYGLERLSGFGRRAVSKLPYEPPPGKEEEEALADAVEEDS